MRATRRPALLFLLPVSLLAAFACITPSQPAAPKVREEITAEAFLADVKLLADDKLEGRRTGAPGCEEAARYVAEKFHAAGLQPLGDFGTWYQHFDAVSGRRVEATTAVELNGQTLAAGKEFTVVSGTGTCDARAELFFVGYGLESKSADRHDYAGRDVTGRIVVALACHCFSQLTHGTGEPLHRFPVRGDSPVDDCRCILGRTFEFVVAPDPGDHVTVGVE